MIERYSIGNYCIDTKGKYVHIYDNIECKNVTWCHENNAYDMVREMNKIYNEKLKAK